MTETDLRTQATEIHEEFSDRLDVTVEEVEARLDTLVNEYRVPIDEARRSVTNTYLDEAGMDRDDLMGGDERVSVAEIDSPEEWVDITAKVVELRNPDSDAIAQAGTLGDETGTVEFVSWSKSELPTVQKGEVYRLGNVVTDEYEGQFSVKLNSTTTIEQADTELEVSNDDTEVEGALVDIQSGSGLIKRCPEEDCTRVLQNGRCAEHGEGDGEFDLRIKGVIDDGATVQDVIFDREMTEELTGITLEEAQEMAMDALDTSVVAEEMDQRLLGRYYRVTGPEFNRYVLADEVTVPEQPDHEATLIRARSI
jgi:ssDNA-binding replication factor A large subunit